MRLYSRTGASTVQHGDETFEADEAGAVEFPAELGAHMKRQHVNGQPAWEDDAERQARLDAEDRARRADPASLFDMLDNRLGKIEARLGALESGDSGDDDKPATPKRSHARKTPPAE
jgi:hypothetical protein